VNSLSSSLNSLEWIRSKVLELSSQGHSQPEIARILQISQPTVNRDIGYLRGQARQNLQKYIQDKLPEEYQNCITGINQVLKICWEIVNKSRNVNNENGNGQTITVIDNKTVLQTCLLSMIATNTNGSATNGVVITDAIKFVQTNKEKLMSKEDDKESKEPDYEEDKDQLEEKQKDEIGESSGQETTNQVF
jgi:predicted transcriptional regulator